MGTFLFLLLTGAGLWIFFRTAKHNGWLGKTSPDVSNQNSKPQQQQPTTGKDQPPPPHLDENIPPPTDHDYAFGSISDIGDVGTTSHINEYEFEPILNDTTGYMAHDIQNDVFSDSAHNDIFRFSSTIEAFKFACSHPEIAHLHAPELLGIVLSCEKSPEETFGGSYTVEITDGVNVNTLQGVVFGHEFDIAPHTLFLWKGFSDNQELSGQIATILKPTLDIRQGWKVELNAVTYNSFSGLQDDWSARHFAMMEEERRHDERFIDKHMQGTEHEIHGEDDPRFSNLSYGDYLDSSTNVDTVIEEREIKFRGGHPVTPYNREDSDE